MNVQRAAQILARKPVPPAQILSDLTLAPVMLVILAMVLLAPIITNARRHLLTIAQPTPRAQIPPGHTRARAMLDIPETDKRVQTSTNARLVARIIAQRMVRRAQTLLDLLPALVIPVIQARTELVAKITKK